ncbi:MAG: HAD family hydrolase [Armatimonadetes bacterium]|nr:HAD family hydrolase [Armatimonadota bacterium]
MSTPPRPTGTCCRRDAGATVSGTIEIVRELSAPPPLRFALFDFDGTLSLIREGWQGVMIPYFVEVLLGTPDREAPGNVEPENVAPASRRQQAEEVVREFVTRLTGKQTIYQCFALAEEVERRGGTPLEALDYKHEYLRRLWERIAHRVEALKSGAAQPDDMLVRGSRALLTALRDRGVTCYLASGTDIAYVQDEAAALKVDGFFGPHIYGALDDYKSFSKQMIIDRILQENDLHGPELVVIGDGYVEIENGRGVGGRTIGVASDEAHPGGLDEWKRTRLIGAGADAIVPDFADLDALTDYLFGNGAHA